MKTNFIFSYFFPFLAVVLVFTDCTTGLTVGIRNSIDDSDVELKNVQFYNSERIVLERIVKKDERIRETSGRVKFRNGKLIERVIFRDNTPGICTLSDKETMHIQFEKGDGRTLPFKLKLGMYTIDYANRNGKFIVWYDNREYEIIKGLNACISLKKSNRYVKDRKRRRARGMKVSS